MAMTCRIGHWVTADLKSISKYVKKMPVAEKVSHPALLALQDLIEIDPEVYMLFTTMFTQKFDPPQVNPIEDYMDMLLKMQEVMLKAPEYGSELGSAPINSLLIYVMATPSGTMAFINDKVNKCFKEILNSWAQLLNHPDSREVLNRKDGWLCPESLATMPDFLTTYKVDLTDPYYGFKSWNDYFARKLKNDEVRPIAEPTNPFVICSPCDAIPYFIEKNPNLRDQFWIKAQPYSLQHLLDNHPLTDTYVGGTVFQAFLDTANYHRWHSPLDGKITNAYVKEGAYYAEALSIGYDPTGNTLRYLSHVDTRAIIEIDTGNPQIGTVMFVAVGMAEVASCVVEAYYGQQVKKGDPLGTFQFGGSSYCLLFQKGVTVKFTAEDIPDEEWPNNLQYVNSKLGTIFTPIKRR